VANPVYVSNQVTVGTSPTLIATPGTAANMVITNGAAVVFLGGSGVTTTTGLSVAANATVTIPVTGGQQASLYGVSATSSVVSYLFVV
jgi:hypothetical protein